jgi:hypothetical protein
MVCGRASDDTQRRFSGFYGALFSQQRQRFSDRGMRLLLLWRGVLCRATEFRFAELQTQGIDFIEEDFLSSIRHKSTLTATITPFRSSFKEPSNEPADP